MPGSVAHVAAKIGRGKRGALVVLRQLADAGLAEQTGEGWRLTAEADRLYGQALREMDGWLSRPSRASFRSPFLRPSRTTSSAQPC